MKTSESPRLLAVWQGPTLDRNSKVLTLTFRFKHAGGEFSTHLPLMKGWTQDQVRTAAKVFSAQLAEDMTDRRG